MNRPFYSRNYVDDSDITAKAFKAYLINSIYGIWIMTWWPSIYHNLWSIKIESSYSEVFLPNVELTIFIDQQQVSLLDWPDETLQYRTIHYVGSRFRPSEIVKAYYLVQNLQIVIISSNLTYIRLLYVNWMHYAMQKKFWPTKGN